MKCEKLNFIKEKASSFSFSLLFFKEIIFEKRLPKLYPFNIRSEWMICILWSKEMVRCVGIKITFWRLNSLTTEIFLFILLKYAFESNNFSFLFAPPRTPASPLPSLFTQNKQILQKQVNYLRTTICRNDHHFLKKCL